MTVERAIGVIRGESGGSIEPRVVAESLDRSEARQVATAAARDDVRAPGLL